MVIQQIPKEMIYIKAKETLFFGGLVTSSVLLQKALGHINMVVDVSFPTTQPLASVPWRLGPID